MIVDHIETLHREHGLSYREACSREGVCTASFFQWRKRQRQGDAPVLRPGPAKVEALDLDALREEVRTLRHGRRRTAGTGALYQKHRGQVSRRDLHRIVQEERDRKKDERNRIVHQVHWKQPGLIWATDDSEYQPDTRYPKAYLHLVQDLASRYKFAPLVSCRLADGDQVAAHLAGLFHDHGPPLFLKRDNGSNLNHHLVEAVLGEFLVIPLNSPCAYPQFNGGIERAQSEVKSRLREHQDQPYPFLAIQAEIDIERLNHKRRRSLGRRTPCDVLRGRTDILRTFHRRKRREVYDTIKTNMLALIETGRYDANKAWRMAVETWLLEHRFIAVSKTK